MMIDWEKIERLMRASFTGKPITDSEQGLLAGAHAKAPVQYAKLHRWVKEDEVAKLRML